MFTALQNSVFTEVYHDLSKFKPSKVSHGRPPTPIACASYQGRQTSFKQKCAFLTVLELRNLKPRDRGARVAFAKHTGECWFRSWLPVAPHPSSLHSEEYGCVALSLDHGCPELPPVPPTAHTTCLYWFSLSLYFP